MRNVSFFRGASTLVADIKPDAGSIQVKQIMGADEIRLNFVSSTAIDFRFADWCEVFGEKYIIQQIPVARKVSSNQYFYNLTARNETLEIEKAQYLFLGEDNTLRESDFALMGTALDFVNLVVTNINRISSGWSVGSVVASTQYRNMTFSKDTCLSALSRIAEEYETEFWISGKTVSLGKMENVRDLTFQHGRNGGLYEITRQVRDAEPLITRLYAYGAEKNLAPDYRGYSKRLKMTGGVNFIENNTDKYGTVENTAIFDDIYPRRQGTVSVVDSLDVFYFEDDSMDFDLNDYLLGGVTAKVTFNTGQLSGLTFEIASYNHVDKAFKILLNKDNSYIDLPNDSLKMDVGDKYVLTDIRMPDSYIIAAEAELLAKATEFLARLSEPTLAYQVTFDQAFFKQNSIVINIGDVVRILDTPLGVDREIRVVGTTRDIVNEYDAKVELSDRIEYGVINRLQVTQDATIREVAGISSQLQNRRIFNNTYTGNFRILSGTILVPDMPSFDDTTGKHPVWWDPVRGTLRAYIP